MLLYQYHTSGVSLTFYGVPAAAAEPTWHEQRHSILEMRACCDAENPINTTKPARPGVGGRLSRQERMTWAFRYSYRVSSHGKCNVCDAMLCKKYLTGISNEMK